MWSLALAKEGKKAKVWSLAKVEKRKWAKELFLLSKKLGSRCSWGKGLAPVGLVGRSEVFWTANGPEQSSTYSPPQLKVGERLILGISLTIWCACKVKAIWQAELFGEGMGSKPTCSSPYECCYQPQRRGRREMVISLITAFQRKGRRGEFILPEAFVREAKRKLSWNTSSTKELIRVISETQTMSLEWQLIRLLSVWLCYSLSLRL